MNNKEWYSQPMVLWNLWQSCWHREVSLEARPYNKKKKEYHKRAILFSSIEYGKALLANDDYEVLDLYSSLPEYDLTEAIGGNRENNKKHFSNKPLKWIHAYDFDSKEDPLLAFESLLNAWEWLASTHPTVKWSIKFSGSKGFHLESDLKQEYLNGMDSNRILAESLKLMRAPCTDTVIYSPRREWRCPWSIHHSGLVAMPFTMQELLEFINHWPDSKKGLTPEEVMKRYPINNQSFKWIAPDARFWAGIEELKKAVKT